MFTLLPSQMGLESLRRSSSVSTPSFRLCYIISLAEFVLHCIKRYITENGVDVPDESLLPLPRVIHDTYRCMQLNFVCILILMLF
jgi:hypothetical protein